MARSAAAARARPAARRGAAHAPARRPRAAAAPKRRVSGSAPARTSKATTVRNRKAGATRTAKAAPSRGSKAAPTRRPRTAPSGAPLAIRVVRAPFVRSAHVRVNRMLDRLLHGQGWIALVGLLLAGIVFTNVYLLQMNRDIAGTAQRATVVKHENARLRLQLARLASTERIQRAAVGQGLLLPAPGDVRYLRANPMIDSRLAARRMVPPGSQGATSAPAPQPQATPVSTTPPATAAPQPQPQAQSAPVATATPPSTPAPAPITPPAAVVPTAGAGTTAAPTG